MKKTLFFLLILLSNNFIRANNKLKSSNEYTKEVSFDFSFNVPIIKVTLNGKDYRFLFDTGMPTAISEEIFTSLNLKVSKEQIDSDVNGNSSNQKYTVIDNIIVSGIKFERSSALIVNFKNSFELSCLKIDGVFGNNLIKDVFWKINYSNKTITFSNDIKNLNIPENIDKLRFKLSNKSFSPKVSLKVNGKKVKNIMFDTGSSGGLRLNYNILKKKINSKKSIEIYGSHSTSLYGRGKKSSLYQSVVNKIFFGASEIKNYLILLKPNSFSLLGNNFLKDYLVFIDYKKQLIYLKKENNIDYSTFNSLGFKFNIDKETIKIGSLVRGSQAELSLKIGYEILEIDNLKIGEILNNNACNTLKTIMNKDSITLKFKTFEDEIKEIKLQKEVFIE